MSFYSLSTMSPERAEELRKRAEDLRKAGYFDPHYDPGAGMFGLTPLPDLRSVDAPVPPPRKVSGMDPQPRPPRWYGLMLRQRQGDTVNGVPIGSPWSDSVDANGNLRNERYWEAINPQTGQPYYAPPWAERDQFGNLRALPWEGGTDSLGNPIWIDVFECGPNVPADRRKAPPVFPPGWPPDRKPPWLR